MNKGNLRSELQEIVKKCIAGDESNDIGEFSIYDNRYDIINKFDLENLPQVEDYDGDMEDVDFENFYIIDITDDMLTIFTGGDWQKPICFYIIKTPTSYKCEIIKRINNEMTTYEFLRKLFEVENPETILGVNRRNLMDWWELKKWGEK